VTRVLVLDDDVVLADLMRIVLEEAGYEVVAATSADALPAGSVDCVVTDLVTVTVYTLAAAQAWLARLEAAYTGVPLIVVTGHVQASRDAAALGVRLVIMKPFDLDRLTAAVAVAVTS